MHLQAPHCVNRTPRAIACGCCQRAADRSLNTLGTRLKLLYTCSCACAHTAPTLPHAPHLTDPTPPPTPMLSGSTLCEQGDEGDCLWVLSEGSLQVTQYLGDRLTVTADPEHPCILGDNVLLQGEAPMFRYRCFTIRWAEAEAEAEEGLRLREGLREGLREASY